MVRVHRSPPSTSATVGAIAGRCSCDREQEPTGGPARFGLENDDASRVSDPRTELQLRLGKVAENGQAFEVTVALVLARSLDVSDEIGSLVAGQLGVATVLRMIALLAGYHAYPLDAAKVKKWVEQAQKANAGRNAAIHESWAADAETGEITRTLWKRLRGRVASLSELEMIAADLHEAIRAGEAVVKVKRGSVGRVSLP